MKPIIIHIKELGAIRNSSIEIKPLTILSGESGLGKSYVAILMHYFYKMLAENRLDRFFEKKGMDFETIESTNPEEGSLYFDSSELVDWINQDSIEYMRGAIGNKKMSIDISFEIPLSRKEYHLSYRTDHVKIAEKEEISRVFQLEKEAIRMSAESQQIGVFPWKLLVQDSLKRDLLEGADINQTFAMVPGRGALLNLPITLQDRIKGKNDIYTEFLFDWEVVRTVDPIKRTDTELVDTLYKINEGTIEIDPDKNIIYRVEEDKPLPISAAASSIKELAPLYMLLDKYPADELSILFEEPEAHLHPQKQIKIADFVVLAINKGVHMQITTHSDYFLRRLNDRIFLHMIKKEDEKVYQKTINTYLYSDLNIDPSLIGAYLLHREKDGTVSVISQTLEKGIPYESFYSVISDDLRYSMDIQEEYYKLKENHVE